MILSLLVALLLFGGSNGAAVVFVVIFRLSSQIVSSVFQFGWVAPNALCVCFTFKENVAFSNIYSSNTHITHYTSYLVSTTYIVFYLRIVHSFIKY